MSMLPPQYQVVTATVDADAGEIGTIYQACNFDYAQMKTNVRYGAIVNGTTYSSRTLRYHYGTGSMKKLRDQFGYDAVIPLPEMPKGRYFGFRGGKIARKHNRRAIAHLVQEYPKRAPLLKESVCQR
jgi:hypothetical protein